MNVTLISTYILGYLNIRFLPPRKHKEFPLQRSLGYWWLLNTWLFILRAKGYSFDADIKSIVTKQLTVQKPERREEEILILSKFINNKYKLYSSIFRQIYSYTIL